MVWNAVAVQCVRRVIQFANYPVAPGRLELRLRRMRASVTLPKKNRITWARIRYNSFTVAVVVVVVYNSPGIAEQLIQLYLVVVVAFLGFLSCWFIVAQTETGISHIGNETMHPA